MFEQNNALNILFWILFAETSIKVSQSFCLLKPGYWLLRLILILTEFVLLTYFVFASC